MAALGSEDSLLCTALAVSVADEVCVVLCV